MGILAARRRGSKLGRPRADLTPEVLALIVQLRLEGMSWRKVAVALKEAGHFQKAHLQANKWRPDRAWSPATLQTAVEKRGAKAGIAALRKQGACGNGPAAVD